METLTLEFREGSENLVSVVQEAGTKERKCFFHHSNLSSFHWLCLCVCVHKHTYVLLHLCVHVLSIFGCIFWIVTLIWRQDIDSNCHSIGMWNTSWVANKNVTQNIKLSFLFCSSISWSEIHFLYIFILFWGNMKSSVFCLYDMENVTLYWSKTS